MFSKNIIFKNFQYKKNFKKKKKINNILKKELIIEFFFIKFILIKL